VKVATGVQRAVATTIATTTSPALIVYSCFVSGIFDLNTVYLQKTMGSRSKA
jgi:hypothetical protein